MDFNFSLRNKLLLTSLAIGLLPVFLMGLITTYQGASTVRQSELEHLQSIRDLKKTHIEKFFLERKRDLNSLMDVAQLLEYEAESRLRNIVESRKQYTELFFRERLIDAKVFSRSESLTQAVDQFSGAFKVEGQRIGGMAWKAASDRFATEIDQYRQERGFDDVLLLDTMGNVVYAAAQGSDAGGNIHRDPLDKTSLNTAFTLGLKGVHIEDFAPYAPVRGEMSAFITAPVQRFGEVIGVLALRLSVTTIDAIVQSFAGMGKSGRVAFLTPSGPLPRSSFYPAAAVALTTAGDHEGDAKEGSPIRFVAEDGSGILRLASVMPVNIPGLQWRLEAGVRLDEVINPVGDKAYESFFSRYVQNLGYENLYMVQPGGRVFFAARPSDLLGVNLLEDPRSKKTHLAGMLRTVLEQHGEGISDLIPLGLAGDAPFSFIARPLLANDKVALVVVLQMADTFINDIMKQRHGSEDNGETYLVGPDHLLRSDPVLDPEHFSVRQSFANPDRNRVDTPAVRRALEQQSGSMESVNYRNDPVFVSFAPVQAGQVTWALVAERDRDAVLRPVRKLQFIFLASALAITLLVVVVGWWSSRRITQTLTLVSQETVRAAGEIAATILQQERISRAQADAMTEVAAGMERLFETARRSVEQADAAVAESGSVLELAKSGEERLSALQGSMDTNGRSAESVAQQIRSLSDKFVQIDEISAMMTDFAVETKMLAMNAAVEAVRAGAKGKGFTVLAEEIRKLAEDSKRSTDRINNLVLELRQVTTGTVKESHEGARTAQEGLAMARETIGTFAQVTASAENAAANAGQITLNLRNEEEEIKQQLLNITRMKEAAGENASGIALISEGVRNFDRIVRVLDGFIHGRPSAGNQ
ncbi:MAG: hypothetical protein HQL73_02045 [Magnetococcales bacterium]|nr:hypothetical protein [Magnetococcales bacterium]